MNVHAAGGEKAVRRIIALLTALAMLAERAAGRSLPVRCFVFFILRFAESVVTEYVLDVTGTPVLTVEAIAAVGNEPDNAMLLALRLRALAAALAVLLPVAGRPDRRPVRCGGGVRCMGSSISRFAVIPGGWTPEPIDTS